MTLSATSSREAASEHTLVSQSRSAFFLLPQVFNSTPLKNISRSRLEADRGIPVDSVAMNAGVGVGGEFVKNDLHEEIRMINLNIVSLVHLTKHLLPHFINRGHGRILFTSSLAATMPGPYYAVYAASKAFVQSFAEAIRFETKDSGVTALQPGATDTNFFERAHMMNTKAAVEKKDDPADVAKEGFDALMAGRDHVIAGSFMNNVQAGMAKVMPQTQSASVHASSVKPGSAHK